MRCGCNDLGLIGSNLGIEILDISFKSFRKVSKEFNFWTDGF